MENRLLLVVNPCSGQRKANKMLPEIIRALLDEGWRVETYVTCCEGDATMYIGAHGSEVDRVVCIGGDGTLNETIAGVQRCGKDIPIGYIPAGTTNDYANSIGLPLDMIEAARVAAAGVEQKPDIGSFNGRSFTYTASCGAFTRVSYDTPQQLKNALGHLAYVLEGIMDLSSLHPFHLKVEAEGTVLEEEYLLCCVTNSKSIGGVLKLGSEQVALDDGLFEVMLVRNPTQPAQLTQILNALKTQELPCDMIRFFHTPWVRVTADEPIEWTLDGERADAVREAEIRNLHGVFRLVTPAEKELDVYDTEEELCD